MFLTELDDRQYKQPSGWSQPGSDCPNPATIRLAYKPWNQGWGNGIQGPAITGFGPSCGGGDLAYTEGMFKPLFLNGYLGYAFPFPSAHVAQLRDGTMNASTDCTTWGKKSRTKELNAGDYQFQGYMTVETTLRSFSQSQLKSKGKALDQLQGKYSSNASAYQDDPFDWSGGSFRPTGKVGCH